MKEHSALFSPDPHARAAAARSQANNRRVRKSLAERTRDWPPYSPGAFNAWLLLVTTKPPSWEDPLMAWPEAPVTLGEPHEGFFYPDPRGFWAEVRRWVVELLRPYGPQWGMPDALSITMLVHLGDEPDRFRRARQVCEPRMILFLDGPSWDRAGLQIGRREPHFIHDPHRQGQVYEGFWGRLDDGVVVGKAPQHPATHNLYRTSDMTTFLRAAPRPEGV